LNTLPIFISSLLPGVIIFSTLIFIHTRYENNLYKLLGTSFLLFSFSRLFTNIHSGNLLDFYNMTLESNIFKNMLLIWAIFFIILLFNSLRKKPISFNKLFLPYIFLSIILTTIDNYNPIHNYLICIFFVLISIYSIKRLHFFLKVSHTANLQYISLLLNSFSAILMCLKNNFIFNVLFVLSSIFFSFLTLIYYLDIERRRSIMNSFTRDSLASTKRDIIAIIGHEIRTPLIAIQGYIELLQKERFGPLNEKQKSKIAIVTKNTEKLCEKVDEIIQLSRLQLEENNIIETEIIPLKESINNIINIHKKKNAYEKEMNFDLYFPDKEIFIRTNQTFFYQILNIIIDNSTKFSKDPNKVNISVSLKTENDLINITIKDYGIGIEEDKLKYLFLDFYQDENGLNRTFSGLGLGLSLADKLINKLKGRINVSSIKGQSFTVDLYFPIKIEHLSNLL